MSAAPDHAAAADIWTRIEALPRPTLGELFSSKRDGGEGAEMAQRHASHHVLARVHGLVYCICTNHSHRSSSTFRACPIAAHCLAHAAQT